MNIIDTLITDRTGGYYNATDLNRVGAAIEYIAERFRLSGADASTPSSRFDWTANSMPKLTELYAMTEDIEWLWALLERFSASYSAPQSPWGYFMPSEQIVIGNSIRVMDINAIEVLRVIFTGSDCANLIVFGAGWQIERMAKSITATYQYARGALPDTDDVLALLTLTCDPAQSFRGTKVSFTLSATGRSGNTLPSEGEILVRFQSTSWSVIQASHSYWGSIEGKPWADIETTPKP